MFHRSARTQTSAPPQVNPLAGADPASATVAAPVPSLAPALRNIALSGPAGRLEALLNEGRPDASYVTLLCHPHPLGGGTMHNKVVYHAMKVFHGLGWPVLRFNFRGVGLSQGVHDGRAEADDVRAALQWLAHHYNKPIVAAGFSFGAAMGLQACCDYPGIHGFAALGLPTHAQGRDYRYPFLAQCSFPKLFLSGGQDQFAPAVQLRSLVPSAPRSELILIEGADHFFHGHLDAMQHALRRWLLESFGVTPPAHGQAAPHSQVEP
jgi:uncharacterized protein